MPNSPIAQGSQTRLSVVREVAFNTMPTAPVFQIVRVGANGVSIKPKYTQSKEVRSDGRRPKRKRVGKDVGMRFDLELSVDTHDARMEEAMRSSWVKTPEIVRVGVEIASVAGSGVYTVAAGLGTPFKVGHITRATGFAVAANNGIGRNTATASGTVTAGSIATSVEATAPAGARLKVIGIRAAAAGSISASSSGGVNKLIVATTDPAALGLAPGMVFRISGFVTAGLANNGYARVAPSGISGAGPWDVVLDIAPSGFVTNAAATETVSLYFTDYLREGTTRLSIVAEQAHLDKGKYKYALGLVSEKLNLKLTPESIIEGSAEYVGASGGWQAQVASPTYTARTTTDQLETSSNLGAAYVDGAWITGAITGADITLMPNPRPTEALGVDGTADIPYGAFGVEGSITKYFLDEVMNLKMMNGTPTGLLIPIADTVTGHGYVIDIRRATIDDGDIDIKNSDDPLTEPYKFVAEPDETLGGVMCHIQKIESYGG